MEIIKEKKVFSIIISTYNQEKFIEEAIESVLNQDFQRKKIEIIVVDDGSTDKTSEKVKKYKDEIKYIYKENKGQASCYNVGIKIARGEYISLLDADDYFLPEKLKKVAEEFEKYKEVGSVIHARKTILMEKEIDEDFPEAHNIELNENTLEIFVKGGHVTPAQLNFRAQVLKNVLPIPEKNMIFGSDGYLFLTPPFFTNFSFLKEKLSVYRIHGENLFYTDNIKKFILSIKVWKRIKSHTPKVVKKSKRFDSTLFYKFLLPFDIEMCERELIYKIYNGKCKREDLLKLETKKIKYGWGKWGFLYRLYNLLKLPYILILPPKWTIEIKNFYFKKKLYKIREFIFPK
jgi:glycosyltransferase involved in cell wall biosynthesis